MRVELYSRAARASIPRPSCSLNFQAFTFHQARGIHPAAVVSDGAAVGLVITLDIPRQAERQLLR